MVEQLNNSLRKLSTFAAYSKVDNYIRILEVFITVRNLSVKKIVEFFLVTEECGTIQMRKICIAK